MTDPTPTQDTITARLEELLAKAMADDDDHMVAGPDNILWLMTQLACWPIRVDPDCTTNDRFLRFSAVATMQAILSERATLKAELEEARGAFTKISGIVGDAFNGKLVAPLALDAIDDIAKALTKEPTNGR